MEMDVGRFVHYKIDIKVIQLEHSIIIQQFHEAFEDLADKKDIKDVLDYIYDILLVHFKNEEKFMVMIDYPYIDNHTNEHKKLALYFKKTISDSKKTCYQSRFMVSLLQEQFLKHIDEQDKQIETFYYSIK